MKVYDGFLFNDELDLLELRLRELDDLVDVFVLVESPHNWQQQSKPLFYADNRERFKPWADKIRHVICDDYEVGPHPKIEWPQRRAIARGFEDADMTDLIMIGDADEIASRSIVQFARKRPPTQPYACRQYLYYYWINCLQAQPWYGTIIMPRGLGELDIQQIRDTRMNIPAVPEGGYHFAWLGSVEQIQYKLRCHTIADDAKRYGPGIEMTVPTPDDAAHIAHCRDTGADLFRRNRELFNKQFIPVRPGVHHPTVIWHWLREHPELCNYSALNTATTAPKKIQENSATASTANGCP